jgi:hypothetical protein
MLKVVCVTLVFAVPLSAIKVYAQQEVAAAKKRQPKKKEATPTKAQEPPLTCKLYGRGC